MKISLHQGRGTVVTGRIERQVKVGEEVEIVGFRETRKTVVTGWKCSRAVDEAWPAIMPDCCSAACQEDVNAAWCWQGRIDHAAHQVQGRNLTF